jgi:hypothetical protein
VRHPETLFTFVDLKDLILRGNSETVGALHPAQDVPRLSYIHSYKHPELPAVSRMAF